ncbi:hypothetical protein QMK17_23460 [Rhodococcus sp. G-MC3]|uniref:hypothetical protein n=1 Tax=Rhodococcus sp. G-MC3 TaxID=3046209 RepID=UPI0024BABBD9|nr:hypothetical protein [Rhodococcus sp. G-MC3]MDJ0396269.1 hypothetical protein [Rhodococcus sp. G-MC3]
MLRHSFALRWYCIATFVAWQRTDMLTDAVLTNLALEALPVNFVQKLTWDSDALNPLPAAGRYA